MTAEPQDDSMPYVPTPSDVAGAIHRNLMELVVHIQNAPAMAIDAALARRHLAHAFTLLDALQSVQAAVARHAENGAAGEEPRAN